VPLKLRPNGPTQIYYYWDEREMARGEGNRRWEEIGWVGEGNVIA